MKRIRNTAYNTVDIIYDSVSQVIPSLRVVQLEQMNTSTIFCTYCAVFTVYTITCSLKSVQCACAHNNLYMST